MGTQTSFVISFPQASITRYSGWQIAFTLWGKLSMPDSHMHINKEICWGYLPQDIICPQVTPTPTQQHPKIQPQIWWESNQSLTFHQIGTIRLYVFAEQCFIPRSMNTERELQFKWMSPLDCLFRLPDCPFCPLPVCHDVCLCSGSSYTTRPNTEHAHQPGNCTVRLLSLWLCVAV